jgi:hypothetical protein
MSPIRPSLEAEFQAMKKLNKEEAIKEEKNVSVYVLKKVKQVLDA